MITHNGTYLLHATHHGMPIYAATMGGKMVIGDWLLSPTQQAILAAFGSAEGTEVIRKTNDYLNRIATTDPQRALLLAGFINEDPMLVCSLVETSKTRWLVGDGKAYVETGVTYNTANNYKAKFALQFTKKNVGAYQLNGINAGAAFGEMNGKLENGDNSSTIPCEIDTVYNVTQYYNATSATCEIDGVGTLTRSTSSLPQYALIYGYVLFGCRSKEEVIYLCNEKMQYFNMEVNNVLVRKMYPFIRNGENGMLDIISGTFYPNANTQGAFTIQLTSKTTETTS